MGLNGFEWVLLGFTGFYWVLLGFASTSFDCLPDLIGFCGFFLTERD